MAENTNPDLERQIRELQEQNQERAKEIAVLEEKMNTKQQEYKTDIARLAEQMANWKTDMSRRDTEAGRRENRNLLATLGGLAVATAIISALITAQ